MSKKFNMQSSLLHMPVPRQASRAMLIRSRELRQSSTKTEEALWCALRGRKLHGLKFYRQVCIGRAIADFYCPQRGVVVEVDGSIHRTREQRAHDRYRDSVLAQKGLSVVRFRNEEVFSSLPHVLDAIASACHVYRKSPPPQTHEC
jgi:very-short-patch-repair endonuclease